jgi:hypothetical protein
MRSLEISARVRITEQGKRGPWVGCSIWLYDAPYASGLRMRGAGPFGMTLFDILSVGGNTTIRLPRDQQEFSGRFFSLWKRQLDAEELKGLIILALKPWKAAEGAQAGALLPCGDRRICFTSRWLSEVVKAGFISGKEPPFPLFLKSDRFQVNYSGHVAISPDAEQSGFVLPSSYPKRIKVRLLSWDIQLELMVKSIKINGLSDKSQVFSREAGKAG